MNASLSDSHPRFYKSVRWLLAAFGFLVLLISWIVPLDFGPDEPLHLEYVHRLAFEQRLPTPKETHIIQHPPPYYAVLAVVWRVAGADMRPLSITPGPAAMQQTSAASKNARRVLRALQLVFALGSMWLMAQVLLLLRVPENIATLWLACIALWPMFGSVSAVVNNENAAIFFSSIVCLVLVRQALRGTTSLRDAFLIGLMCGAGVLVKQTTMFVWPVALWCVWSTSKVVEQRARNCVVFLGATLLLGIWWPLYNFLDSGTPFPSHTIPPDQFALPFLEKLLETPGTLRLILETSFLPDWASRYLPREISGIAVTLVAIALGLWFWASWKNPSPVIQGAERRIFRNLQLMSVGAMAALVLGVLQYIWFRDYAAQIGGRYLLSGLPWLVTFLGAGWNLALRTAQPQVTAVGEATVEVRNAQPPRLTVALSAGMAIALLLIAIGWWIIAWTQYQALIASAITAT